MIAATSCAHANPLLAWLAFLIIVWQYTWQGDLAAQLPMERAQETSIFDGTFGWLGDVGTLSRSFASSLASMGRVGATTESAAR